MTGKKAGVRIICNEDCGNSPKNLFLKNFNIAAAKTNRSLIKRSITEDVVWHLFEPAGEKIIAGREIVVSEYETNLVIVPVEFVIDTIATHGYDGAVNGRIKAKNGKSYVFADFYKFNSVKGAKIKSITSYIIESAASVQHRQNNL